MTDGVSISKHAPPTPVYLSERMTVSRMLEVLQQMQFNSHEQAKVVLDPGVRDYLLRASRAVAADPEQIIRHAWRAIKPATPR